MALKHVPAVVAGLAAAFAGITWWALESGGVAVLETRTPDGAVRSTHVWFVEPDGALWVEAGTRENPWFRDVQRTSTLRLTSDGRTGRYEARIVEGPAAHRRIRALLREKYGLRDRWIGLLVDTSGSVAVELVPASRRGAGPRAGVASM